MDLFKYFLWISLIIDSFWVLNGTALLPIKTSGCGSNAPVTPGVTTKQTIKVNDPIAGELDRVYLLRLPSDYNNTNPYNFIIDFHGYYMDGKIEERDDKLSIISDPHGVIVVFPYGSNDSRSSLYGWNCVGTSANIGPLGHTCDTNRAFWGEYQCYTSCTSCKAIDECYCSSCWNDTLFISEMLNYFESSLCINKRSIHSTGISNGGMMVYQIGQLFSNIFASLVPIAGSCLLGFNISPLNSISLMEWHGTNDNIVPSNITNSYEYPKYLGPYNSTFSSDGFYYTPTKNITILYSKINNCQGENYLKHYPITYDGQRQIYCVKQYGECQYGTDVIRCTGKWGHTWPLHEQDSDAYPNIVWDFISTHLKQNVTWKE